MKIEWDEATKTISVGKAKFKQYAYFGKSSLWASEVLRGNALPSCVYNTKEQNKVVADLLGCSRATLFKHFSKLQNKVFVAPVYEVLKRISPYRKGRGFDPLTVNKVNENLDVVLEVYRDGLYNLLPIVAATGKTPAQLKGELRGEWKVIANNSLSKNNVLVRYCRRFTDSTIGAAASYPTTLLKQRLPVKSLNYLVKNFKGKWGDKVEMLRQYNIYSDTERLATKLGCEVGKNWSARRMKEEHDRMSKEVLTLQYSKASFESLETFPVKEHSVGEYKATLLSSAHAIAEEGAAMGHCVAMYADAVCRGSYLVYSVTKAGVRSSTIGVHVTRGDKVTYRYGQHYGRFNANIENQEEGRLAETIVEKLNSYVDAVK